MIRSSTGPFTSPASRSASVELAGDDEHRARDARGYTSERQLPGMASRRFCSFTAATHPEGFARQLGQAFPVRGEIIRNDQNTAGTWARMAWLSGRGAPSRRQRSNSARMSASLMVSGLM
jgi:hypothetical protein